MRSMMLSFATLVIAVLTTLLPAAPSAQPVQTQPACGDVLAYQILLDRRGFSPGEIDGQWGSNATRALSAFQEFNSLPPTGQPDCATWQSLAATDPVEVLTKYRLTRADTRGPFIRKLPLDLMQQARLPRLHYSSVLEKLGERFQSAPELLKHLNPKSSFTAGQTITVPTVTPFAITTKPPVDRDAANVTIEVSRGRSDLRARKRDGTLVFYAPVSSGSEHDPLPIGQWRVTAIYWMPVFHYNPALFWDADPAHAKATIKSGPNGPVGVVWIDINVPHYGLHGTPEPARVGHAESHGCVRLANWNAARVASMVRVGTPVLFTG